MLRAYLTVGEQPQTSGWLLALIKYCLPRPDMTVPQGLRRGHLRLHGGKKGDKITTLPGVDWLMAGPSACANLKANASSSDATGVLLPGRTRGSAGGQNYKYPGLPQPAGDEVLARKSRPVGPTYLPHTSATPLNIFASLLSSTRHAPLFSPAASFRSPPLRFRHLRTPVSHCLPLVWHRRTLQSHRRSSSHLLHEPSANLANRLPHYPSQRVRGPADIANRTRASSPRVIGARRIFPHPSRRSGNKIELKHVL